MARANYISEIIRRPKRVRRVNAVFTEGEADFLIALCSRVKGDPTDSPVKYARRVRDALVKAVGYDVPSTDAGQLVSGFVKFARYARLRDRQLSTIAAAKAEARAAVQLHRPAEPDDDDGHRQR